MQAIEGAVIACAGLGSRLGMGMPKCMIEIEGRTLLSRLIDSLRPLVPRIHIVVGYREDMIMDYCARFHRDVVIVRNTEFRSTNTAHSINLGSVGMRNKVLYLDGDLVIDPASLKSFIEKAATTPLLIGTTKAKSTQAVFVHTKEDVKTGGLRVKSFCREPGTKWEWANVFAGSPHLLTKGGRYVYECIEPSLPAEAHELTLYEIDTPEDLIQAQEGIAKLSL